jgi:hypothetical protein
MDQLFGLVLNTLGHFIQATIGELERIFRYPEFDA